MELRETDLPGIGKKYDLVLESGKEMAIIIYSTGKREIYLMEDEEPLCTIELSDEESREIGFLLAGAVYQPIPSNKMELIMKEMVMEWIKVEEGSNFENKTIADLQVRKKTGASIIAIVRGDKIIPSPDPYKEIIRAGDTLVVVGTRNQVNQVISFCKKCKD